MDYAKLALVQMVQAMTPAQIRAHIRFLPVRERRQAARLARETIEELRTILERDDLRRFRRRSRF
jgi:hypothetical protein